jgi:hypothetical protein
MGGSSARGGAWVATWRNVIARAPPRKMLAHDDL